MREDIPGTLPETSAVQYSGRRRTRTDRPGAVALVVGEGIKIIGGMMAALGDALDGKRQQGEEKRNAVPAALQGPCHGTLLSQSRKNNLEGIPVQQKKRFRVAFRTQLNRRLFSILRKNFPGCGFRLERVRQKQGARKKKQKYWQQKQK